MTAILGRLTGYCQAKALLLHSSSVGPQDEIEKRLCAHARTLGASVGGELPALNDALRLKPVLFLRVDGHLA
eukprot:1139227-Pelagomonas_calceolata.AAC.4